MPSHSHTISGNRNAVGHPHRVTMMGAANTTDSESTESAGSDQSHNNMPPYLALNYIIKY
jgi:microcystin-dependent protein